MKKMDIFDPKRYATALAFHEDLWNFVDTH